MQTSTHKNRGIKNLKKKEDWMNERKKKRKNHKQKTQKERKKERQKERKKVSYRNPVIYIYVTEQVMKSVSQIRRMNNLQSTICVTQSQAN